MLRLAATSLPREDFLTCSISQKKHFSRPKLFLFLFQRWLHVKLFLQCRKRATVTRALQLFRRAFDEDQKVFFISRVATVSCT